MGLYIEDQKILSKQEWLIVNGRVLTLPERALGKFELFRLNRMFPVALIDNLAFYAAGVCFNKNEWSRFKQDESGRRVIFFLVPEDKIYEVVGKDNPYFKH